jgi:hypothetical protein
VLRIETSKNYEPREIALRSALKVVLEALAVGHKPEERLFPINDTSNLWKRLCNVPGFPVADAMVSSCTMREAALPEGNIRGSE